MQNPIEQQVEQVIQYRKQLIAVETKCSQFQGDVPAQVWLELVEISRRLEQAEEQIRQACHKLAGEVNQLRGEIMTQLSDYNHWRDQIRQVEEQFLLYIVRPGYQLKLAVRQRERLEQAYQRIYEGIQREGYPNQEELAADIHRVLAHDAAASEVQEDVPDETLEQEESLYDTLINVTVDDVEEAISREELVKEFKRIVIPKIHPDTSNTSNEVFINVYESYKKGDPLLMEAYIAEYRGEIAPEKEADVLESFDQINNLWKRYQRLLIRLARRFEGLKKDLTQQELENPEKIKPKFADQRQEILSRIQDEAEKILYWRGKIEGLLKDNLGDS